VLLAGAALALGLRSNRASAVVAIASQALACALVLSAVVPVLRSGGAIDISWRWPPPMGNVTFQVDALGAFFLSWSLPMTLLGTVYAIGYLEPYFARGRHGGPHFALLNMVAASFVLVYSVQNALVFLLGWEIAAVSAWLLVIWDYRSQKIRFAGFNYLVSTHVGLFVLVAAFMLLHSKTSSMELEAFGRFLSVPGRTRSTLFLLLSASFALKSAFFPFHTWLPRAHAAAPAHVSALMSGVIHKAGLFAFLRFLQLMGRPEEWMGWSVLGFGAASAAAGALYSTTQRDLKRLLGYSSTENVGIAAMGFGVGCLGWTWGLPTLAAAGFAGGLLHVLNHAVFKCLLFYGAGGVYRAAHTVDIERLGGLAKRLPRTATLFLIGGLASAALPPLNGFFGELTIYSGLLGGGAPSAQANVVLIAAAAALAFVGAVGAFSASRAFGVVFLGSPRDASVHVGPEATGTMLFPMGVLALGTVVLGLFPALGFSMVLRTVAAFTGASAASRVLEPLAPVLSATRVLAACLAAAVALGWARGRKARRSATWGCGYTAPSPRMQYTASSFTEHLSRIFDSFLPELRRERLPEGPFPARPGHFSSHHADPVERRMFEVLWQGEDFVAETSERIPEHPSFAFTAGLVALVVIGAWLFGGLGH
jgi:hydrogenase-4 component B